LYSCIQTFFSFLFSKSKKLPNFISGGF
jgi:hypothetical protein